MRSSARTGPDTVTLIANYIPLQEPAGGPNFYEFGDDVLYEIHVDNNGDGDADISYQFRFETKLTTPASFLYNTGPIGSLSDPNWNSRQFYSVTRVDHAGAPAAGDKPGLPAVQRWRTVHAGLRGEAGPPGGALAGGNRISVFAGQRAEEFYVDLGSIFDLGNLRPLQEANVFGKAAGLKSRAGRERHQPAERASIAHPGADLPADRATATRPSACGPRRAASARG